MSSSSPYAPFLEKLRLPQPSLQRFAVASLFQKLRSSSSDFSSDHHARDAISRCLLSPSPPVADQAVREVCRLSSSGRIAASDALLDLHSALEACAPSLVPLFVKAIGYLCRLRFRADAEWGRLFDSVELHPFVKVLSCREEVQSELIQQVLLFIVYNRTVGIMPVARFLRPFLMYSVIRKPFSVSSSMFVRDLVSSIASLSCSFPPDAISIIKLLSECLKYFPCTNKEEFKCLISCAEYVVDAFVVVMKQIVCTNMKLTSEAQACSRDILDTLLSLCAYPHQPQAEVQIVLDLSKRLLVAHKEVGWQYFPGFSMVIVSISGILSRVQFEHEHLSILKLLIFLIEWRTDNDYGAERLAGFLNEELFLIFPAISLLSSSSKSVKAAASYLLSAVERLLSDIPDIQEKKKISEAEYLHMSKPMSIPFKLLHQLWFQAQSLLRHPTYLECNGCNAIEGEETHQEPKYWTSQLRVYLLAAERLKVTSTTFSQSAGNSLEGVSLLLGSVASVLVMHPVLGSSAVDSLAAIGQVDPKLGLPLLQAILFFIRILCINGRNSTEILLKLLEKLPLLGFHSVMVPLILQTILPMLQKGAKPIVHATAIRLLCKTWIVADRAFGTLQEVLDPKALSNFISEREIGISIAASVRDVCRHNPDRGVDLILSISSCIESRDSTVQALGFESLAHLCEADVVDFYTAWDVIGKHMPDCFTDPIAANGLCKLLRWGALDAIVYPETSKIIVQILWDIATYTGHCPELLWVKARVTAFKSLSHYEVGYLQETILDFKERNLHCLVTEANTEVLSAMQEFQIRIISFEHINRRRVLKEKRAMVHKVEKLLDIFPQVMFSSGKQKFSPGELPGAALLSVVFTPKDTQGTPNDLVKLHTAYEKALLEIAESLHVSRNIFVAFLALQSWEAFIHRWLKAAVMHMHADTKGSSNVSDKSSKAANDIFKILCKLAAESIPRVAVHAALAIGALCTVVFSSAHGVICASASLLMKWLFEDEHEHQQWPAAISLGLICNCFHVTDRKNKVEVIGGLLKAASKSKSHLVRGACGVGLGFACKDLLSSLEANDTMSGGESIRLTESTLLRKIVKTLSLTLCQICPSASESLQSLNGHLLCVGDDALEEDFSYLPHENCDNLEEDAWGIAGIVMGLGSSVVAIYRSGAYDAVLKIKDILISWIPHVDSSRRSSIYCSEATEVPLSIGSCLALPTVLAFCQRTELLDGDFNVLSQRYGSLIIELLQSKKSGSLHQNLLMSSCIGAGSLLSCIMSAGVHSMRLDNVKYLLEILRDTYTHSHPPLVHLGGMIGGVNALGAGAGDLTHLYPQPYSLQLNNEQKESSLIRGPILSNPVLEPLSTSMVQELTLVAKESRDHQIQKYAAWSVSFLRERWWSKEFQNVNDSLRNSSISSLPNQNISEDSLVMNLCLWIRDSNFIESGEITLANTVATVLRCLSHAPRLPALDWGAIVRRCMRYEAQFSLKLQHEQGPKLLREECISFALAHANDFSPLLLLLDELTDLSRFRKLELNLQSMLLYHLADLFKMFSSSRIEKFSSDLGAYFSSPVSSYLSYDLNQRSSLRVSFWKGLHQGLNGTLNESIYMSNIEKCMEHLFLILPVPNCDSRPEAGLAGSMKEWLEAIRCLSKAPHQWLMAMLQVPDINQFHEKDTLDEVAKLITARVRLVRIGCLPISELAKLKSCILSARSEGSGEGQEVHNSQPWGDCPQDRNLHPLGCVWWNVLIDVVAAVSTAEVTLRRQWLLDALEISCIAEHPSTAMWFVSLLSGSYSQYKPLLVVDPDSVLRDLPVTLPSLLLKSSWSPVAESVADKLWTAMERICVRKTEATSAGGGVCLPGQDHISESEAHSFTSLAHAVRLACISLKDYLPLHKQLRLANMEVF